MSSSSQLIIFIVSIAVIIVIDADTHVCDGTNLTCNNGIVNCLDNELCLIQCTGSQDCVGSTINCPHNGDCIIECHSTAGNDGCKVASINAVESLSLTIDNQGLHRGFEAVSMYCPLYGSCTLTGSGKDAFMDINIYAIFGFVFSAVSITCTGNCQTNAAIHCGNEYNSSCVIASDGMSCTNAPDICDTIFTSINGTWLDDYNINPAPGWTVTNHSNDSIHSVYTTTLGTYHGPFYGDADQPTLEIFRLSQHFYCAYAASVYVEYFYSFSCQEDVDYSRLYLNDELYADKHAKAKTGTGFYDETLEGSVSSICPDAWNQKQLNATLDGIPADTLFKVQIDVALNYEQEVSVIGSISIRCIPTKVNPTTTTTTNTTTYHPTLSPTDNPSVVATQNPITLIPTAETTAPTTMTPTSATVIPTESPSNAPTKPTKSPNRGRSYNNLDIWPTQELQMRSSEDVDFGALFVALLFIGGFFVVTVIAVCKLWLKHEKAYRPFYKQQQELIEMMQTAHAQSDVNEGIQHHTQTVDTEDTDRLVESVID